MVTELSTEAPSTLDAALAYARRYWQFGQEPETQAALTVLLQHIEREQSAADEWGVMWQTWATADGSPHDICRSREIAEHVAAADRHATGIPGVVMHRTVTRWRPAAKEGR